MLLVNLWHRIREGCPQLEPVPENHRRPSQTVLGGWELLGAEEMWGYRPAGWHLRSRGKLNFEMSLIRYLALVGDT